jgi:hypothetical protein
MKDTLMWIADNPILTVILLCIVVGGAVEIAKAIFR